MKQENFEKIYRAETAQEFSSILSEGCTRCTLHLHGCKPIVYRGNPSAPILLLGEAPGLKEQEKRKPFVGPAGELLDKIFQSIGLDTNKDMCLSNVGFCRPAAPEGSGKQNYTPRQEQLDQCFPFVEKFIELINPRVIVACGRIALMQLTGDKKIRIGAWEGKWLHYKTIPMFVMTHPAAILHIPREEDRQIKKDEIWKYMQYFRDIWRNYAEKQEYNIA